MKQKIVIKLQMDCEKCRNKALKTAAEIQGVTAVSIDGPDKDRVVVTGDNIDTVCLANRLKKKFRSIMLFSVEEVKVLTAEEKKKEEEKKKAEEKKKEEEKKMLQFCFSLCTKCHVTSCQGKCNPCSKCQSSKCVGHCALTCKCLKPECKGKCNHHHDPCSKCQSAKCDGNCVTACCKCQSPKCHGQCIWNQCPPWCTCPKCYMPYTLCPPYTPCPPYYYRPVVYDLCPNDPCSIM